MLARSSASTAPTLLPCPCAERTSAAVSPPAQTEPAHLTFSATRSTWSRHAGHELCCKLTGLPPRSTRSRLGMSSKPPHFRGRYDDEGRRGGEGHGDGRAGEMSEWRDDAPNGDGNPSP